MLSLRNTVGLLSVLGFMLIAQSPALCYAEDFHYYLTYYIARSSGYSKLQSARIASADQSVDTSAATCPVPSWTSLSSVTARHMYHAFMDDWPTHDFKLFTFFMETDPLNHYRSYLEDKLLRGRIVIAWKDVLWDAQRVKTVSSDRLHSPGAYLHVLQDTYAHRGYGACIGHASVPRASDLYINPTDPYVLWLPWGLMHEHTADYISFEPRRWLNSQSPLLPIMNFQYPWNRSLSAAQATKDELDSFGAKNMPRQTLRKVTALTYTVLLMQKTNGINVENAKLILTQQLQDLAAKNGGTFNADELSATPRAFEYVLDSNNMITPSSGCKRDDTTLYGDLKVTFSKGCLEKGGRIRAYFDDELFGTNSQYEMFNAAVAKQVTFKGCPVGRIKLVFEPREGASETKFVDVTKEKNEASFTAAAAGSWIEYDGGALRVGLRTLDGFGYRAFAYPYYHGSVLPPDNETVEQAWLQHADTTLRNSISATISGVPVNVLGVSAVRLHNTDDYTLTTAPTNYSWILSGGVREELVDALDSLDGSTVRDLAKSDYETLSQTWTALANADIRSINDYYKALCEYSFAGYAGQDLYTVLTLEEPDADVGPGPIVISYGGKDYTVGYRVSWDIPFECRWARNNYQIHWPSGDPTQVSFSSLGRFNASWSGELRSTIYCAGDKADASVELDPRLGPDIAWYSEGADSFTSPSQLARWSGFMNKDALADSGTATWLYDSSQETNTISVPAPIDDIYAEYEAGWGHLQGGVFDNPVYHLNCELKPSFVGRPVNISPALASLRASSALVLSDSEIRIPVKLVVQTAETGRPTETAEYQYAVPVFNVLDGPSDHIFALPVSQSSWVTAGSVEVPALEMTGVVYLPDQRETRFYYGGYQSYVTSQSSDLETGSLFRWSNSHLDFGH